MRGVGVNWWLGGDGLGCNGGIIFLPSPVTFSDVDVGFGDEEPGSDGGAGQVVLLQLHHPPARLLHAVRELVLELDVARQLAAACPAHVQGVAHARYRQEFVPVQGHLEL